MDNKSKKILFASIIMFSIIVSGCADLQTNDETKDETKYITLRIHSGSYRVYYEDESDYAQYDDDLFIEIINYETTTSDNIPLSFEIIDYDIYQPTKYVIKISGDIRFETDPTIEAADSVYLSMFVRDSEGNLIGRDKIELDKVYNHQTVPFTTKVIIENN